MLFNIVKGWLFSPLRLALKLAFWGSLVVFILITVFLLTFNLNSFKEEIETTASRFLQNELKINGDIKLGFEDFRPSLILHDVKIGEDGKTTIVLADRLEVILPFQKPVSDNPFSIFANLENIRIDGKVLGDYDIPIKFSSRGVEVTQLEGGHDDGKLTGNLSLLDGKFHLDAKIAKAAYEKLESGVSDGSFKADIKLDAHAPDYLSSLNGHITILGGDGKIEGNSIGFWGGDMLMNFLTANKKETRLECVVANFDIVNGVARSKVVIIDTQDVTIFGKGNVDIAKGYVDMKFSPKPKNPSLVSFATPVRVRGPFGDIRTSADAEDVARKFSGFLLSAVVPAAALLPLMSAGTGHDNPCFKYIKQK